MIKRDPIDNWYKRWNEIKAQYEIDMRNHLKTWPAVAYEARRKPPKKRTPPAVSRPGSDSKVP